MPTKGLSTMRASHPSSTLRASSQLSTSVLLYFVCFCVTFRIEQASAFILNEKVAVGLLPPDCLEFTPPGSLWRYRYCHLDRVEQFSTGAGLGARDTGPSIYTLGKWISTAPSAMNTVGDSAAFTYIGGDQCVQGGSPRLAMARLSCSGSCGARNSVAHISSVSEPSTCVYVVDICAPSMCSSLSTNRLNFERTSNPSADRKPKKFTMPLSERREMLDKVKSIFYHAYEAYLKNAFPFDELRPLSCSGSNTDLTPGGMLTLIDGLDTLATLGNVTEFRRVVKLLSAYEGKLFEINTKVSVFETTIRILGGLLSAHLICIDPELPFGFPTYRDSLLRLAKDLGDRLLPAFKTLTSVPYGTVHMMDGVPLGETTEACTAAAGSLSLEFGMLSVLTGDPKYGIAARSSLKTIYDLRSQLNLIGRHLDINSGQWTEAVAGIGSNIDSIYEYYLKQYILFGDDESLEWFQVLYEGAVRHLRLPESGGRFYHEVDMKSGQVVRRYFSALQAFWPGVQILVGDVLAATKSLNGFLSVWEFTDFLPEDFDLVRWATVRGGSHSSYLLRPELAESVFYAYRATKDDSWLQAGKDMIETVYANCFVPQCGFAAIQDVDTKQQMDMMPSFFLSEWIKYMFLLFDDSNFLNKGNWVFTTEAHPFRVTNVTQKNGFITPATSYFRSKVETKRKYTKQEAVNDIPSVGDNEDICWDLRSFPPEKYYKTIERMTPQSLRPFDKQVPVEENAAEKKISGYLPDVGMFEIVSTSSSFSVQRMDTNDRLVISNLDSTTAMIWTNDARPSMFVSLRPHQEFVYGVTCLVEMFVEDSCPPLFSPFLPFAPPTDKALYHSGPCAVADGFGLPAWYNFDSRVDLKLIKLDAARHLCDAEMLVLPNRNHTHEIGPFFAYAVRGDCSFEEKAQNAFMAGAFGLVVALTDPKDEPFIMAHAWNGFKEQYKPSAATFLVNSNFGKKISAILNRPKANPSVRVQLRKDPRIISENGRVTISAMPGWVAIFGPQDQGVYRLNLRKSTQLNP